MTERFKIYDEETWDTCIEDTEDCYPDGSPKTYYFNENEDFCDLFNKLNELAEKNEQLKFDKKQLHQSISKERIKHHQFRDKIFDIINKRITHYQHKPIQAPISNPINPRYDRDVDRLARLNELQELQEELKANV